jgi:hypothetical protein
VPLRYVWATGLLVRAGADTAYGFTAYGYSDMTGPTNKAVGVYGSAQGGPTNRGVIGHANQASGTYTANNAGVYGVARGGTSYAGKFTATAPTSGGTNYGVWGKADSASVANYAVYGWGGTDPQDWAGYFVGKSFMDSLLIGTTTRVSSFPERVSVKETRTNASAVAIDVRGGNGNTALYVMGTNGTEDDYLLYMNGAKYGIDQDDVELNFLGGETTIDNLVAGSIELMDFGTAPNCGEATVAASSDTVQVATLRATGASTTIVLITAVDRSPDGGTPFTVARSGSFTIHCTTNQGANQKFSWVIVKH